MLIRTLCVQGHSSHVVYRKLINFITWLGHLSCNHTLQGSTHLRSTHNRDCNDKAAKCRASESDSLPG